MTDPRSHVSDTPIVDEVRRVREELSARAGHDMKRYFEELREFQEIVRQRGTRLVQLPSARRK